MDSKEVSAQQYLTQKRVEFLLQEVVYQLILTRTNDDKIAKEQFNEALKDVEKRVSEHVESTYGQPPSNDGNISIQ